MVRAGNINALNNLMRNSTFTPIFDGPLRGGRYELARRAYWMAWSQVKEEESESPFDIQ